MTRIGVIGGSGLYQLIEGEPQRIDTPYGPAQVTIGENLVFLTRHGVDHSVAPHLINYRANIWALASLGVKAIISSSAVGGISPDYPPGTLALPDQYIDRTWGRRDTFYDGADVQHLGSADPFDPMLHAIAAQAVPDATAGGTIVVIQGPRFSTRAESQWFGAAGAHLVNMTLYPEVPLAAELNIGTVNLSFVTDSDAKAGDDVSAEIVFARLKDARPRIVSAIRAIATAIPDSYAGRELISAESVDGVLGREVSATSTHGVS